MGDVILVLAAVGVTIYAVIDCLRTDDTEMRGLPKPLWLLVILALPLFGGICWVVLGRAPRPGALIGGRSLRSTGPDDDPEFLRSLGRPRRRDDEGDSTN